MSLVKLTIKNEDVSEKNGTKNGKEWSIREQEATLETEDRKQPVRLDLGKSAPHKAGVYTLDLARNLNVSQFGSIQLRRNLELTPATGVK